MSLLAADYRRSLPPRAASWWLLAVPALLGIAIGLAARGDRRLPGDVAILEAVQRIHWPGSDLMVTLSNLTFATGGALVLALAFLIAAWRLGRPDLIAQLAVVMLLRLAGEVLKPIFQSPRPGPEFQPDPSLVPSTLGYPSGHAYTATIVASMLIVFVSVLDLPRGIRWGVSVVAVLITLMALFARVHIGAHWPSDTLGGVLFGVATMAAMQLIIGRLAASGGVTGPCGDDDLLAADRLSGGRDTGR